MSSNTTVLTSIKGTPLYMVRGAHGTGARAPWLRPSAPDSPRFCDRWFAGARAGPGAAVQPHGGPLVAGGHPVRALYRQAALLHQLDLHPDPEHCPRPCQVPDQPLQRVQELPQGPPQQAAPGAPRMAAAAGPPLCPRDRGGAPATGGQAGGRGGDRRGQHRMEGRGRRRGRGGGGGGHHGAIYTEPEARGKHPGPQGGGGRGSGSDQASGDAPVGSMARALSSHRCFPLQGPRDGALRQQQQQQQCRRSSIGSRWDTIQARLGNAGGPPGGQRRGRCQDTVLCCPCPPRLR